MVRSKLARALCEVLAGHRRAECSVKGISVPWKLIQPVHNVGNARSHFERIFQWKQCLVFQRTRSAIPELIGLEGSVDHGWSVAIPLFAIDPAAVYFIVSKCVFRVVTARTACALVSSTGSDRRRAASPSQLFPELANCLCGKGTEGSPSGGESSSRTGSRSRKRRVARHAPLAGPDYSIAVHPTSNASSTLVARGFLCCAAQWTDSQAGSVVTIHPMLPAIARSIAYVYRQIISRSPPAMN